VERVYTFKTGIWRIGIRTIIGQRQSFPLNASTYYDVQKLVEGNTPPLQTSAGVFG